MGCVKLTTIVFYRMILGLFLSMIILMFISTKATAAGLYNAPSLPWTTPLILQ